MKNLRWLLTGMAAAFIVDSLVTMANGDYIHMVQFVLEIFTSGAAFALWVNEMFKSAK